MKKRVLGLTMAMVTAISMTGCGGGGTTATTAAAKDTTAAAAAEGESKTATGSDWGQYDLKLATNLAEDHVACKGYYAFADAVKEATDAPYVFNDGDSMVAFANSDEVQSLYDSLAEKSNLRCLGMYYYGSREVTTNKYAAKTPAELKGCKLRVPDSEMAMAYGAALGATPVVMSLGEVYMGIQQGVVDGQENPLPTINSNAFYEVCDNLLMTDHVIAAVTYTMDENVWKSMPADLQDIVKECVFKSCDSITKDIQAQEAELQDTLKEKGMNIVEVDKDAFKANVQGIYDKYADTWGDWLATAQSFNK